MNTRLTGKALNPYPGSCTLATQSVLVSSVSATSPSTPAVRRPALRSVTRRTLKSVFERDRSINFCNRRTLARSPAFAAVKIRCRNRRTFCSTCRQSIWRQSSETSSGPLPATLVAMSSLSSGSGITDLFLFTDSPDRVSPLSRPSTLARYPAGYPPRSAGGLINRDGFPLPFGHRHSLLGHPVPAGELGSPCGRLTEPSVRTPTGLPRSAR